MDITSSVTVSKSKSSLPPPRRQYRPSADAGPAVEGSGPSKAALSAAASSMGPQDNKQRMCTEILAAGFVQAFVDFFHLTHRADPNPGEAVCVFCECFVSVSVSVSVSVCVCVCVSVSVSVSVSVCVRFVSV